nr:triple tyrosine motif-containing protein [Segatella maculosa]
MKGFEDDWIQLRPGEHGMRYTNLPPGDYEFQVKFVSASGQSNDMMLQWLSACRPISGRRGGLSCCCSLLWAFWHVLFISAG